jgi:hypothetical protein
MKVSSCQQSCYFFYSHCQMCSDVPKDSFLQENKQEVDKLIIICTATVKRLGLPMLLCILHFRWCSVETTSVLGRSAAAKTGTLVFLLPFQCQFLNRHANLRPIHQYLMCVCWITVWVMDILLRGVCPPMQNFFKLTVKRDFILFQQVYSQWNAYKYGRFFKRNGNEACNSLTRPGLNNSYTCFSLVTIKSANTIPKGYLV